MAIKGKHNIKKQQNLHNKTAEELKEMFRQDDVNAKERQVMLTTDIVKKTLLEKLLLGTSIKDGCRELKIASSTLRYWIMRDPVFTKAYQACRVGENLMLDMQARSTLSDLMDNENLDVFGKPAVSPGIKLQTAKFVLEKLDGDFAGKVPIEELPKSDNPEEAFLIIETVSESKAYHDGTGKGNMVVVVESDGEDVRSGVRGKSDEEDFLDDDV